MLYSVALCAQKVDIVVVVSMFKIICVKQEKLSPYLTKPLWEQVCLYWEALKVDFALETLDKKLLYVSRTCLWSWCSETER